ncbi:MAG TPA: type I DNA topoisomerase, partial [Cryptosporangiaceae bacterium]|nr:type I DNA topoisomerase [Cryptosporangiaceae bacterium]
GYVVEASIGHIRDLPGNASEVPEKYKGESWARLGVDVDHSFVPLYVVSPDRVAQVRKLKALVKDASELYLATDEDREGEAIAWHLVETLQPKVPVRRMVFHEITRAAIQAAVDNPRDLDLSLVDAQETRRILDRLYGYEVSPVLWKKVMPKLSAGRVQSVATRIVVERERARMKFREAEYWDIEGQFTPQRVADGDPDRFTATLVGLDGDRVATGRDFDPETGQTKPELRGGVVHLDEVGARGLAARLEGVPFRVVKVDEKPYRRRPYAPFMTSTLQQEGGRKLRFSTEQTMRVAQRLYENGHITYMRTDSTNLSDAALDAARAQVRELYGDRYVPTEPRRYVNKVKNAQEAHEAIRPSGEIFRTPGELAGELTTDEMRLYELIWKRTVASQMIDAVGQTVSIRLTGTSSTGEAADFAASGRTITEPGFLRAYVESLDSEGEADDAERRLPRLAPNDPLTAHDLRAEGHRTQPPARYTEASLVKALEELGIGRPSTYASIMRTIQDRGYVWKKGSALVPSFVAFAVIQLLEQHFPRLVDYAFTADVEEDLDRIATGAGQRVDWLTRFYFGAPDDKGREGSVSRAGGLKKLISVNLGDIDARGVNSIPLFDGVVARVGRYGPYLQRGGDDGDRASLPDDVAPDDLTPERVEELFSATKLERELGAHPTTGEPVIAKAGRFGPYVQAGDQTSSLFASMSLETVTLDDAVKLLSLPRLLGQDASNEPVMAWNGRYGPYVKRGADTRSLENEEQLFTVTLEQALALLDQPKTRGRRAAAPPLRELGSDPVTGQPVVVKEGRFGPYVTDGETNASLRKGDVVESITIDRAAELLADRRSSGPAPRRRAAKKAPAKKAAAKKTGTKASTKATAKKPAAAKAAAKKPVAKAAVKAAKTGAPAAVSSTNT